MDAQPDITPPDEVATPHIRLVTSSTAAPGTGRADR